MTRVALAIYRSAFVAMAVFMASVQAQTPAPARASGVTPQLIGEAGGERTGVQFHDADGAIWARGATYKARADASGLTYIPFLGSSAQRTWPVGFALTEASVGGRALPLARGDVARAGDSLTIDRGSVIVRYDLEVNSVEQSFVIAGVDGRAAELVLRVALETDLTVTATGRGFALQGPDGGVSFGAAIVIDHAGRSLPIETELEGGHLVFRVPAHFLAEAEGNVIIDPVITSFTIDEFGADLTHPDVAFELTGNTYCVVYEESFAATDVDIYWRTLDAATFAILDQGYIDLSTGRSTRPRIASNAQSSTFLVAFQREDTSGRPELYARLRSSAGGSFWAAEVPLTGFDPLFVRVDHDVGGDASEGAGTSNYLVVWEKRSVNGGPAASDIQGCLVDGSGALAQGYIDITTSPTVHNQGPAISGARATRVRTPRGGSSTPTRIQPPPSVRSMALESPSTARSPTRTACSGPSWGRRASATQTSRHPMRMRMARPCTCRSTTTSSVAGGAAISSASDVMGPPRSGVRRASISSMSAIPARTSMPRSRR